MSELQLGLVGIGAAVVVGVFFYNKWKEFEYRREAGDIGSRHEDVLMRGEAAAGSGAADAAASDRVEPVMEMSRAEPHVESASAAQLSEILDFIVQMEAAEKIPGEAVLETAAAMLADVPPGRVRWEAFDEGVAAWGPARPDREYSRLRVGLQLVDRHGAADAEELAEFGVRVQDAAAGLGALCATPDTVHALAKAAELDRFCADVDIRIGVHVLREDAPVSGAAVLALAEEAGFELDDDSGAFRWRAAAGNSPCTLVNYEPAPFNRGSIETTMTHGVTLELDVPRAQHGAFEAFRELATHAARVLGGRIVDDNRRPLGAEEFDAIEAQIDPVYRSMQARGIAPGGPLALRLFS